MSSMSAPDVKAIQLSAAASDTGARWSAPIVEDLGTPFSKQAYARNVWDMQVFNRRIYIGHGNSSNIHPSPNAGPVPVIYYDPAKKEFITQFTVDEEQIDKFRVLDRKLYIPGNDPRESWEYGNFYVLGNDLWIKVRSIPKAVHAYDMQSFNGSLFAAIGANGPNTVLRSADAGKTWTPVQPTDGSSYFAFDQRTYTLINFKKQLYAFSVIFPSKGDNYNNVLVTNSTGTYALKIYKSKMLPGASESMQYYRLIRAEVFLQNMVYISAKVTGNYRWEPEGLYYAPSLNEAKKARIPLSGAVPADMLVRGSNVLVLVYKKIAPRLYVNIVYKISDFGIRWNEVLRFQYDTFARSFEEMDGIYYFGMGCNADDISESCGKILKVDKRI